MAYVRISGVELRDGEEAERVSEIVDEIVEILKGEPGYIAGWRIDAADGSNSMGRITFWQDEQAADRAAQSERVMALRSELRRIAIDGTYQERSYHSQGAPAAEHAPSV